MIVRLVAFLEWLTITVYTFISYLKMTL